MPGAGAFAGTARSVARVVRTLAGVPDYERYVEHVRERHSGDEPLTRDEFVRLRLEERYNRPGSRCC